MSSHQLAVPAPDDVLIAALDIGGTKIAGALVTTAGALVHHVRRTTPAQESADTLLDVVYQVVNALADGPLWEDVRALGIGSAGPVDLTHGSVSPVNIPAWRDFPLVESVSAHPALADRPVVLAGDTVAMAAAEHRHGAARGHGDALCLVVSTGVGAGLILDGQVRHGLTGIAATAALVEIDVAVVGGGVAQAGDVLFAPLNHHLRHYAAMPFLRHLRAVPAELGPLSGLVGAAALAGAAASGAARNHRQAVRPAMTRS